MKVWMGDETEEVMRFKLENEGPFGDRPSVKEWLRLGMPDRRSEVFSHNGMFCARMDTTGMVREMCLSDPDRLHIVDFVSVSEYIESLWDYRPIIMEFLEAPDSF